MNKKILLLTFSSLSIVSILGIVALNNVETLSVEGTHVHSGYHYDEVLATSSTYGHMEHWTCCECHKAFFDKPEGSFVDKGTASAVYGDFKATVVYQYVTFDKQDGTGGTDYLDNAIINTTLPDITVPTRDNYYFGGYYSEPNGAGTQYYYSSGTSCDRLTEVKLNTTLYAKWTAKEYNIYVYSNDENKGTVSGSGTFGYGTDVTVTATPVGDYVLNGWYSDSAYKYLLSRDASYTFTVPSGGKTLYAKFWTKAEAEAWDKAHGVIPVISGSTMTFGLYPQTIVSNPSQQLKNAGSAKDNEEFFYYDGEYYVKDVGNPFSQIQYQFSDGTTIVNGTTYYFICEPIRWNICVNSSGTYTVDSTLSLYAHRFDGTSNAYSSSELRNWLENDFYSDAFQVKNTSSYIQSVNLTDVGVNNAKVWVGSYNQYNGGWSRYNSNNARIKETTDFALCNRAFKSIHTDYFDNATYWTRSPYYDKDYSEYPCFVDHTGDFNFVFEYEDFRCIGIAPALTLSIN